MKGSLLCLVIKPDAKRRRHFAGEACGKRNDSLVILLQDLIVNTRAVVVSFGKTLGYNLHQILIAGIILRKKNQMIVPFIGNGTLPLKAGTRGNIYFTADYGIDAFGLTGFIKVNHAVHNTVVGNRQVLHSELFCTLHHLRNLTGAVKKAVLRMYVQMCKSHNQPPRSVHVTAFAA